MFEGLNIVASQGVFFHMGVVSLFSYSLFAGGGKEPKNLPLGLLFLWVSLSAFFFVYTALVSNMYDVKHFFIWFNFLSAMIFYKLTTQYYSPKFFDICKSVIQYGVIFNLLLGVLQYFNCGQYFQLLWPKDPDLNGNFVGMVGNGTHLSGFFSMCSPLFFTKKRQDILTLLLIFLSLFFTGTTKGDPAQTGFIVLASCGLYWSFFKNRKVFYILTGFLTLLFLSAFFLPKDILHQILSLKGRLGVWIYYWEICKQNFITGIGLGSVQLVSPRSPYPMAYHLHIEYYHFLTELGIIGLALIVNMIIHFMNTKATENSFPFKVMVVGFLVSCLFNYPAHVWLCSIYALFAYAIVISEGRTICREVM